MVASLDNLARWAAAPKPLWLFLDYDGTLADFSSRPDLVEMQPEIVALLLRLSAQSRFHLAIISGRNLQSLHKLLPVKGIFLAGVYGVEIQTPSGELIPRVGLENIRPFLDKIKPRWEKLINGDAGFFLEDKGWSLTLHASQAEAHLARYLLSIALDYAQKDLPLDRFRFFIDQDFLEVAPLQAHKGETVRFLFEKFHHPELSLLYIGDDDKDEAAFPVVHDLGGIAVLVSDPPRSSQADYILRSPQSVHRLLAGLL